jgi:hypothetical protein
MPRSMRPQGGHRAMVDGADDDGGAAGGGGTIIAPDWETFANFFAMSVMPGLKHQPIFTDLFTNSPDWTGTASGFFGLNEAGGQQLIRPVFLGTAQDFIAVIAQTPNDFFSSMQRAPWFVAVRARPNSGGDGVKVVAACIRLGNAQSCNVGLNPALSTAFYSIWSDSVGVPQPLSIVTTRPYVVGETMEAYLWYDGCSVQAAIGNFQGDVAPVVIGEMLSSQGLVDQPSHPGAWIQSLDGSDQFEDVDAIMGKCLLI